MNWTITEQGITWEVSSGAVSLDGLSDVVLTNPTNGQGLTYNGTNWVNSTASGSGDVVGPASSTDGLPAIFSGTTGKLLQALTAAQIRTNLALVPGTDVQAYDADLAAIAALVSAADKMLYATGSGTWSLADLTAFARTLLDDANAGAVLTTLGLTANGQSLVTAVDYAAMRTLLGLVIGTNVQAYDADLTTWAGLTPSANAQSLVTAADYAAMRVLLGLVIGTDVQAYDAQLADVAGLTPTDNGVIIGNGTNFVVESGATLKTSLGLTIGTDVQAYSAVLTDLVSRWVAASASGAASLDFLEDTDNGTNKITLKGQADLASNYTVTLPDATDTLAGISAVQTFTNKTLTDAVNNISAPGTTTVGYLGIPQNSKSAAYTTVMADAGKHIYHPSTDNNARTFTIDSNANVAYPIGTTITFINEINTVTIAITSDTLVMAGTGSTGSRTLAANGMATAIKVTSTRWIINGEGLT